LVGVLTVTAMRPSMQDVGLAVKQLQWKHHREANRLLQEQAGLSLVQWDVLRDLDRDPDSSLHDLAVQTFQTDQSMGELAKRMVARGLLVRVDGPGRAVRHRLSARGMAAFEAGSGIVEGVLAKSIGTLTADEQASLHAMLTKATAGLSRDENA
jgi:DNA-binding MarR family transcriptional regulator